jgi:hypothetical protein
MAQTWHDLLFMHWPVAPDALRPMLPPGLTLDTWEGAAWVGVVPFRMSGIRARANMPFRGLSAFPELNVRTYVTRGDKPGVWFFSLDADHRAGVEFARRAFHLPYLKATMSCLPEGESIRYACDRTDRRAQPGAFHGTYGPTGPVYASAPGTHEHWLTERYCLYAADRRNRIYRAEIHHAPWPLQPAAANILTNTLAVADGITLPDSAPLLHFARRLDVLAWLVQRV